MHPFSKNAITTDTKLDKLHSSITCFAGFFDWAFAVLISFHIILCWSLRTTTSQSLQTLPVPGNFKISEILLLEILSSLAIAHCLIFLAILTIFIFISLEIFAIILHTHIYIYTHTHTHTHMTTAESFTDHFCPSKSHILTIPLLMPIQVETVLQKSVEGNSSTISFTPYAVANSIGEFTYNPKEGITYFRRYEEIFRNACKTWTDEKKVSFLLWKLSSAEHEKHCNYILPKKSGNITFDETVLILSRIFSVKSSLLHMQYLMKKENDDYFTYTDIVNRECKRFKLNGLKADNFKCLMFVQGLTAERDSEIQSCILSNLEADLKLRLQAVAEEYERIMNLRHDTAKIQEKDVFLVQGVRQKLKEDREKNHINDSCGCLHLKICYPFRDKMCFRCWKVGHRQTHCKTKKRNLQKSAKAMLTKKIGMKHRTEN